MKDIKGKGNKEEECRGEEPAKVYSVPITIICGVAPRQQLLQKNRKEEGRRGVGLF